MLKQVVQVKPTKDFKVYVYFSDGKIKLVDISLSIRLGGIFEKIADIDNFIALCTVMNGTLAWDIGGNFDETKCLDLDPETLYSEGIDVLDPLNIEAS